MSRAARGVVALLAGALTFLVLHLVLVAAWSRVFLAAPWPGYEESARLGLVPPWFVNTPRSLWLARAAFFLLALGFALARRRGRWPTALLLWLGASAAIGATYATTSMPALPSGRLGFMLYPFRVLLPILLGTGLGALVRRYAPRTDPVHDIGGSDGR